MLKFWAGLILWLSFDFLGLFLVDPEPKIAVLNSRLSKNWIPLRIAC